MDWGQIAQLSINAAVGTDGQMILFALAAIGLNVHFGYTGLLNFGQVGFLAMGAYGIGVMVTTFDLPFGVGILVGLGAAVVFALLLGIPTLRLRADYLAIVTIAASEIVRLTLRSVSLRRYTGGSTGLTGFSDGFYALNPFPNGRYDFGPLRMDERQFWVFVVGWGLIALSSLLVFALMRSPWGRVLKAIREDEDAVRSLGKNVFAYKMQSLVIGGVIGALGGFIFALGTAAVQPDNYGTPLTFFAYTIVILGGAARVLGPVVGAVIFWFLFAFVGNVLIQATRAGYIPSSVLDPTQVGQVQFMFVGLGLMALMVFRPQGVFGDRREIALDAR